MKFAKIAAYWIGGLAALSLIAFALPRHVSVERRAVLDAAPDTVLALAASTRGYQSFNPYLSVDPDLEIAPFGPEAGIGAGFHFDGKDGTGTQVVAEMTADRVVYQIDLGALGQPVQSIAALRKAAGTEVIWRVETDLGFNPVFRVFGLFMDTMMGPTFELGLENLAEAAA